MTLGKSFVTVGSSVTVRYGVSAAAAVGVEGFLCAGPRSEPFRAL